MTITFFLASPFRFRTTDSGLSSLLLLLLLSTALIVNPTLRAFSLEGDATVAASLLPLCTPRVAGLLQS
jgi:hypothetical protein